MEPKDDYVITILKFARDRTNEGELFHMEEFLVHARSQYRNISRPAVATVRDTAMTPVRTTTTGSHYVLNLEGYAHLRQHEELQQARQATADASLAAQYSLDQAKKDTRRAEMFAFWAIFITSVVGVFSIALSIMTLTASPNSMTISETQVTKFQEFIQTENNRLTTR